MNDIKIRINTAIRKTIFQFYFKNLAYRDK